MAAFPPSTNDLDAGSDEELLNLYFDGDAAAFQAFFRRHAGRVHAYAASRGLTREAAQEVVQETFFKLHRNIHRYERGRPALAWFFTIVHRVVVDAYRAAARPEGLSHVDVAVGGSDTVDALVDGRADAVLGAMQSLPEGQRRLVEMKVVEGLSYREIADATGKSEVSLRKAFERTLTLLRRSLGRKETQ